MKIIKKYWYIIVLLILLIISLCFYLKTRENKSETKDTITENKEIINYAIDYYNNFVSINNINEYDVTVKMLKDAVTYGLANYDQATLEQCEETSYIKLFIKQDSNEYENHENHLICKK